MVPIGTHPKKSASKLLWRLSHKQQLPGEENQTILATSCHGATSLSITHLGGSHPRRGPITPPLGQRTSLPEIEAEMGALAMILTISFQV